MTSDRLQQLMEFLKEDPDNAFNLYALAIEYSKSDLQKTEQLFNKLLNEHPDYHPTYYHAGKLQENKGRLLEAKNIYYKGIEICQKQGKLKTVAELQNALQNLSEED